MKIRLSHSILACFIILFTCSLLYAQEEKQGMPPAPVVVSEVHTGMVAPESEFVGTVYFQEVSDVACEVEGKVETISFEEGQAVDKGDVLVQLNSDILMSDLEKARLDFDRASNLYQEELISEQEFDERRFEKERLEIILNKKTIRTPFKGIILKKHVERGEWLSPGSAVATIAGDDSVDIIAEVPEDIMVHIKQDMKVTVQTGRGKITGRVFALIPRGDISTRTFPVRIRAQNTISLIEGMEARVLLPTDQKQETLTVPRDAVISMFGMTVIFAVIDDKAKMLPVKVAGYDGLKAGVFAEGLSEGMKVVVKGNERLRDGQAVQISH